jgi:hypothetical protein
MTQIIKMFQVDIQIDEETYKIVLRSPTGEALDITNCVHHYDVDVEGTASLSLVATTRKCKQEPKKTEPKPERACSVHPDQPGFSLRGVACGCGETILTLSLCRWCFENLSLEDKADLSLRNYDAGYAFHKSGQVHQEWAARQVLTWRTGKEFFSAPCPFCEYKIRDVWGASTSDGTEVVCPGCGKTSKIVRVDGGLEVVQ